MYEQVVHSHEILFGTLLVLYIAYFMFLKDY